MVLEYYIGKKLMRREDMRRKNEGKGRERKEGGSKPEILEKGPCISHPGEPLSLGEL